MASSRSKKSDPSYYAPGGEHEYNQQKVVEGVDVRSPDWTKEDQAYHEQAQTIKKGAIIKDKKGTIMGSTKYKPE